MYIIPEKRTAGIPSRHYAHIIQVVCTPTGNARCLSSWLHVKMLLYVIVLIAVGTAQVKANNITFLLEHLRYHRHAQDKSATYTQYEVPVALKCSTLDIINAGRSAGALDHIVLTGTGRVCNGAELPERGTGPVQIGLRTDGSIAEVGIVSAIEIFRLFAGR
jgi:hypothetical protein